MRLQLQQSCKMVVIQYNGDSEFFCTLTDAKELSLFYCFLVKHDETNKEYIVQLEVLETSQRGQAVRITKSEKEQLQSGKYIYKAFGTDEQITEINQLEGIEPIEIGILIFKETRAGKEYYK